MASRLQDVLIIGIRADQPAAADVATGTLYAVSDEDFLIEQSDGAAWNQFGPTPTSAAITSLTGDVTAAGPGAAAATIANDAVTFAKMQNIADGKLLGNFSGGAGNVAEYGLTSGLEQSGGNIRPTAAVRTQTIGITVDGGGSVVTTGIKGYRSFPVAGTIIAWRLLADQSGDVDFDVTLDPFASYPPTTSIFTPSLSGADSDEATGLSQAVTAGDVFGFEITGSPVDIERVTLEIVIVVTG